MAFLRSFNLGLACAAGIMGSAATAQDLPPEDLSTQEQPQQDLSPELEKLLREAHPAERDTIENVAKRSHPEARDAIDDLIDDIEDEEELARSQAPYIKGWVGEGALGASLSTGNVDQWGLNGSLNMVRESVEFEHEFNLTFNLAEVEGARTDERIRADYRIRDDFADSPFFAFGHVWYERNPFQGFKRRFTEAAGVGVQVLDTDDIDWEVTAGPALRQVLFVGEGHDNRFGGFASTDFEWDITDTLTFKHDTTFVTDDASDTSITSLTSLTDNVYGNLAARLSFQIFYESDPALDAEVFDTNTAVSLVLDF